MDCGEGDGRLTFQFLEPFYKTVMSRRWLDYLSELPREEAFQKHQDLIRMAAEMHEIEWG